MTALAADCTGFVIIGRNEGARLLACLASIGASAGPIVYVDSGSTDGSREKALAAGVDVIELDTSTAFTAARARNQGFARLTLQHPGLEFVQFVDGDCTLDHGWIAAAQRLLVSQPEVALACGRRRERFPERSIYNAMCDSEWDGPVGSILECGGDFLIRVSCFKDVGGFRDGLIAGEEPELCLRLREQGWQIWRLAHEMTLHDANITRFTQWWRRATRGGHAFAEVARLHRRSTKRIWQRNVLRALVWSALAPIAMLAALVTPWSLLLLFAYPAQLIRQAARGDIASLKSWRDALFGLISKFAETQGIVTYYLRKAFGRRSTLIEYK